MSTYQTYTCRCGKDFTARTADRKRGWARFCSKSCKASEQEGRTSAYREFLNRQDYEQAMADNEAGWDGHKNAF